MFFFQNKFAPKFPATKPLQESLLSWKLHLYTLGEAFWWWCLSLCLSFSPSLMWGETTLAGEREIFCGLDALMCLTGVHLLELSRTGRSSLSLLCPAARTNNLDLKPPPWHFKNCGYSKKKQWLRKNCCFLLRTSQNTPRALSDSMDNLIRHNMHWILMCTHGWCRRIQGLTRSS